MSNAKKPKSNLPNLHEKKKYFTSKKLIKESINLFKNLKSQIVKNLFFTCFLLFTGLLFVQKSKFNVVSPHALELKSFSKILKASGQKAKIFNSSALHHL